MNSLTEVAQPSHRMQSLLAVYRNACSDYGHFVASPTLGSVRQVSRFGPKGDVDFQLSTILHRYIKPAKLIGSFLLFTRAQDDLQAQTAMRFTSLLAIPLLF